MRGKEINKKGDVIRLGNYFWQNAKDYGKRTDYMFCITSQIRHQYKALKWIDDAKLCRHEIPEGRVPIEASKGILLTTNGGDWKDPKHMREGLKGILHNLEGFSQVRTIRVFNEIVFYWRHVYKQKLEATMKFTKGTVAGIIAMHYLKPEVLYFIGCQGLETGSRDSQINVHTTRPMEAGHDYANENKFLHIVGDSYGTKVEFI